MLARDMYDFRDELNEKGIIFCYSGYITEAILSGIGSALKTKLALEHEERARTRSLFAVFVEQVQNVIRYSAERIPEGDGDESDELRYGVLIVGKSDDKYFVSCANLIAQDDVARLNKNLDKIQSLDAEGLKVLFKQTLKGETPEGSKGAGVGFVDIARRASHGFEFDFTKVDDTHSYFCLKAYV
ncbi:MAG: hypothetical protein COB46_08890 [Rhodospirillaceae bacterium]|nr:MAG: hypothetical protein COB46_08890 [Rhodospirillaceae bacterium]